MRQTDLKRHRVDGRGDRRQTRCSCQAWVRRRQTPWIWADMSQGPKDIFSQQSQVSISARHFTARQTRLCKQDGAPSRRSTSKAGVTGKVKEQGSVFKDLLHNTLGATPPCPGRCLGASKRIQSNFSALGAISIVPPCAAR
jgi:hypothetical protein